MKERKRQIQKAKAKGAAKECGNNTKHKKKKKTKCPTISVLSAKSVCV